MPSVHLLPLLSRDLSHSPASSDVTALLDQPRQQRSWKQKAAHSVVKWQPDLNSNGNEFWPKGFPEPVQGSDKWLRAVGRNDLPLSYIHVSKLRYVTV